MKLQVRPRLVLFPLLIASVYAQTDPMQQGAALFRQGHYEEALSEFRAARHMRPVDAALENFIGITESKLGRLNEANQDYQDAIRLNPKLPEAHKNLAFNYLQAAQYAPAETQLKIALALDGADPATHYYLVILYLSTQRDHEVVANLDAAQQFLKDDPETAVLALKACLRSGASVEAEKLANLVETGSGFSAAQEFDLAATFGDKGMFTESAERYRRLLRLAPASWEAKYDLAVTLTKVKQTVEASTLLASLEAEHEQDPKILSLVASAAEYAGNSSLALKALQGAIAADPNNPDRYLDYTQLLMDLNRYEEAAQIVSRGIMLAPDPYALKIRLGAIEMMMGDHEKATINYRQAIEMHPEVALGYVALAQTYMKDGDDQQALKVLSEGRSQVPADFALEYVFGLVSSELGQEKQAILAFVHSEQLNPNVVETHYQLGMVYFQEGQLKDAQQEFENVLRLDNSYPGAFFQLSRLYARMGDMQRARQMAAKAQELGRTQEDQAIQAEKSRLNSFRPQ